MALGEIRENRDFVHLRSWLLKALLLALQKCWLAMAMLVIHSRLKPIGETDAGDGEEQAG